MPDRAPAPAVAVPNWRFWIRVWPRGDCWEYRGQRLRGYGMVRDSDDSKQPAHRYAFHVTKGPLLAGQILDHLCNHPWCVKPSHLVVATCRENTLRSATALAAINARKTHCNYGHEFTPENTRWCQQGKELPYRMCKICDRRRSRVHEANRRPRKRNRARHGGTLNG